MQNRLITIHLNNADYFHGEGLLSQKRTHGIVEEHLREDLAAGWTIKTTHFGGGDSDKGHVSAWIVVVLEKP